MKNEKNYIKNHDYEILFNDSSEYFIVLNAKMIQEGDFVRFICFDDEDNYKCDEWYPLCKIHRVKRYKDD